MAWASHSEMFNAPAVSGTVQVGGLSNGPWAVSFGGGSANAEQSALPQLGTGTALMLGAGVLAFLWLRRKKT